MPFPTAHPAAVLLLRRYCPHVFNFPALVIGSLVPDAGYAPVWSSYLGGFSHSLAGSFLFCLPIGLLAVGLFYGLRRPALRLLPRKHQPLWEAACAREPGPLPSILLSLLVGAWGHLLLDAFTHSHGWFVRSWPWLRIELFDLGRRPVKLYHVVWVAITFLGTAWVGGAYGHWLRQAHPGSRLRPAVAILGFALLFVALVFPYALAHKLLPKLSDVYLMSACAAVLLPAWLGVSAALATARPGPPGPTAH